jgi:hypothetical protein
MTSTYVFSDRVLNARPSILPRALAGVAIKVAYFSLTAIAFVFVSILLTGVHA